MPDGRRARDLPRLPARDPRQRPEADRRRAARAAGVSLSLVLDAGYAADQSARPGTANLTMAMLDEGTKTRNCPRDQRAARPARAPAWAPGRGLDTSSVSLSALADKLEPSLEIFADVLLNPVFPQKELDRLRKVYLAALSQEKTQPTSMALRVVPKLLYGEGHAYAQPLTGTGTEATLAALTREDLARFHANWFRPNHATLIAVGPVTVASLKPQLERLLQQLAARRHSGQAGGQRHATRQPHPLPAGQARRRPVGDLRRPADPAPGHAGRCRDRAHERRARAASSRRGST